MDPPDHTRWRAIFDPFFSPAAVEGLRPFIASTVARLLDGLEARAPDGGGAAAGAASGGAAAGSGRAAGSEGGALLAAGAGAGGGEGVDLAEAFSFPVAFETIYRIMGIEAEVAGGGAGVGVGVARGRLHRVRCCLLHVACRGGGGGAIYRIMGIDAEVGVEGRGWGAGGRAGGGAVCGGLRSGVGGSGQGAGGRVCVGCIERPELAWPEGS
jgi:hypothetical protein